jgi:hypothetical protein
MGRREMRAELEASWSVYEAREPGTPFRRKDIEDADELRALSVREMRDEAAAAEGSLLAKPARDVQLSRMLPLALIAQGSRR